MTRPRKAPRSVRPASEPRSAAEAEWCAAVVEAIRKSLLERLDKVAEERRASDV